MNNIQSQNQVVFIHGGLGKVSKKSWPLQVPSAYYIADMFLLMDKYILGGKLFRESNGPKTVQAAAEGLRVKKCMGALRYLWRNSREAAHHPYVAAMKSLLQDSPLQQSRQRAEPEPESDSEPEAGDGSDDEVASGNPSPEHDGGEPGEEPEGEEPEASPSPEPAESDDPELEASQEEPAREPSDEGASVASSPESCPEPAPGDGDDGDDGDSGDDGDGSERSFLSATTLRLGDIQEPADSQREGAWMGSVYKNYGGRDRPPLPPIKRCEVSYQSWTKGILKYLKKEGIDECHGWDPVSVVRVKSSLKKTQSWDPVSVVRVKPSLKNQKHKKERT